MGRKSDGMMGLGKPSLAKRKSLVVAGHSSHDALHVINDFYHGPETADTNVHSQYWQVMVAVLCERVCRAERQLEEVRKELFDSFNRIEISESWLLDSGWKNGPKRTFNRDVDGLAVSIWRSSSGPWWCVELEGEGIPVNFQLRRQLTLFLRGISTDGDCPSHDYELSDCLEFAVCRDCGKRDSIDVFSLPKEQR